MTAEPVLLPPPKVSGSGVAVDLRADKQWWRWSGKHPVGALLITAFVATQIATTFGYFFPAVGLPTLAWPLSNGTLVAPATKYGTAASYFAGQFSHYLNGIAFVLIFAILVHPMLRFGDSPRANLLKALFFGLIMTLISDGVLVPLVYAPHTGLGFMSFGHGWKLPAAILLWHIIFVVHIAALWNPAKVREVQLEDAAAVTAA